MSIFVNFTNHPSNKWEQSQISAAESYGRIVDVPFPAVDPKATSQDVRTLASEFVDIIMNHHPAAVLCQGEFTLCYSVINSLKKNGIIVLAACTERMVEENESGKVVKFIFEGFREY